MGGISLTASMRSNLLSLQNISGQVDLTQNKLSTGKKVNSAIDNPSSYYTALSLNNRADDLNALLDSMGQAVSTIKAATTALESAADFLEQAKAVANQALETAKPIVAQVSTEDELLAAIDSGKQGLIIIENDINMSDGQNIELKDGQSLIGANYFDKTKKQAKITFNFTGTAKPGIYVKSNAIISNLDLVYNSENASFVGVIDGKNNKNIICKNLDIFIDNKITQTTTGGVYGIMYAQDTKLEGTINIGTGALNGTSNQTRGIGYSSLTVEKNAIINIKTSGSANCTTMSCDITLKDNAVLNSYASNRGIWGSNVYMHGNSTLNIYNSLALCDGLLVMNDSATLNMFKDTGSSTAIYAFQEIYMNSANTKINTNYSTTFENYIGDYPKIQAVKGATFNTSEGSFICQTDMGTLEDIPDGNVLPSPFTQTSTIPTTTPQDFMDIFADFDAYMDSVKKSETQKDDEPSEEDQYKEILNQYDALIKDASYKGINLLQTDKLSVKFNETNTADLNVQGKDMSSKALGLVTLNWQTQEDISKSIEELTSAINSIRSYSSELGNNYNIITTRQDFTNSLINVLTEGADKLTLADMNEESANMLALQTRQQLAINSLSLASQASQSILKLF